MSELIMNSKKSEPPEIRAVLILEPRRLNSDVLHRAVASVYRRSAVFKVAAISAAHAFLAEKPVDLLIAPAIAPDGDMVTALHRWTAQESRIRRLMVLLDEEVERAVLVLRTLPIEACFDAANEGWEELQCALRTIRAGRTYWSPSLVQRLARDMRPDSLSRRLSPREQAVFALIGDGSDDKTAAAALGIRRETVTNIRRQLHLKLGIHNKGELQRLALSEGFVQLGRGAYLRSESNRPR